MNRNLLSLVIILCTFKAKSDIQSSVHTGTTDINNNCSNRPFNITAKQIHHVALQSCPNTLFAPLSINTSEKINCVSDHSKRAQYMVKKCDLITKSTSTIHYDVAIVRRRQLISSSQRNFNLVEACISYEITEQISDCVGSIFLPICLNSIHSQLTALDINALIADKTFDVGTNVENAVGAKMDKQLGILVEFINNVYISDFKICLKNIIISTDDLYYIHSIDASHGFVVDNSGKESLQKCNIDGIPCFSFFFQQQCAPDTSSGNELENVIVTTNHDSTIGDLSTESNHSIDSNYIYHLMFDLSPSLLLNIWGIVVVLIFLNVLFCFCFCFPLKSSSSFPVDSDDDISEIVLIV